MKNMPSRFLGFLFVVLIFLAGEVVTSDVLAQNKILGGFSPSLTSPRAMGPVTPVPQCFEVVNRAPYSVTGGIYTNYFIADDGTKARHTESFRLKSGERLKACTSGPFYEGMKVDFIIRSFVPLFSCRTRLDGPINIYGKTLKEGGTKTWAECYE